MNFNIEDSWNDVLKNEFKKDYFLSLIDFVSSEYKKHTIYPPKNLIFNAFNECSFNNLKVVIIGQDPYHGDNQAHGLSFSVLDNYKSPPSLHNIFKERYNDLNLDIPSSGNLINWSKQGVLLLNSILTVRRGKPGSHRMKGWELFTDKVIDVVSSKKRNIVFLLWGAYACQKGVYVNKDHHLVVQSSHPSPFSVNKGFFGSKPFSRTNEYLRFYKKNEINW